MHNFCLLVEVKLYKVKGHYFDMAIKKCVKLLRLFSFYESAHEI